jgi:uncharacterized SAM-binding protein YcdF (DUF218 family)
LSLRGLLVLVVLFGSLGAAFILGVYSFLSITEPVEARYLAMEGWIDPKQVVATAQEFRAKQYERVFTTGGPPAGMMDTKDEKDTVAYQGAQRLRAAGIPSECVQAVGCFASERDRTYHAAIALRDWLKANNVTVSKLNLATADIHARRSRLLFQHAFGADVQIGIIAVPTVDYDARHWWRYSQGVRSVVGETIAYLYAVLFFKPGGD